MNNPLHILIVEDIPIAQKVIDFHMTQVGCVVEIASNGVEALQKALETHYDAILMDISLGKGPDGFEITTQIKQHDINKATPVMAVTAHDEEEYHEKAEECGMLGYFNKPFSNTDAQIIVNAVNQYTQSHLFNNITK